MTRQRSAARRCALAVVPVFVGLLMFSACSSSGTDRGASKPPTITRRATSTTATATTRATPSTTAAGPTTTNAPLTDDAKATVAVDLTGSVHLHSTFTKPDGCQTGAPKLPFVVLVLANASDGSRIRFSPALPVAGTFTLGDLASVSSLEGLVLEVAGTASTAGTQLSAPQSGTVTFDDAQGRAGHFRVSGLQSTTPTARNEVLDVTWTCG